MPHALIVTDIFGCCSGSTRLQQDLARANIVVHIADPYQGKPQQFADEDTAYAAYRAECGHDDYAAVVTEILYNSPQPFDLAIGFSAGATALWRALTKVENKQLRQAMLYYPGQIHQHLALTPLVPTEVIFGHSEPHFAVDDICRQLHQKGITAISTLYAHGFVNPVSKAFDESGYQQQLNCLLRLLC